MTKSYLELSKLKTFEERYEYLQTHSTVAEETFGQNRWVNQDFYRSTAWRRVRDYVIARDFGCEMGLEGYEIEGRIIVHHINPILVQDIIDGSDLLLDPDNLVCVSETMHNAIHYGNAEDILLSKPTIERMPGDTNSW